MDVEVDPTQFREEAVLSVRGWAVASAVLGPVGLIAATNIATALVGSIGYNAVTQTMSVLASTPQSALVMTAGFIWCGACQVVTAAGLRTHRLSRIVLSAAGICGLMVAAFPVSADLFPGSVGIHLTSTAFGTALLACWPLIAARRSRHMPWPFRPPAASVASLVLVGLLVWLLTEALGGRLLGLSERVTVFAEVTWPAIATAAVFIITRNRARSGAKEILRPAP